MEQKREQFNCKCCSGVGTQVRTTDGIRVLCPCCGGSGEDRKVNQNIKFPPIGPDNAVYC